MQNALIAALGLLALSLAQALTPKALQEVSSHGWSLQLPQHCAAQVQPRRVRARPTYSAEDARALQENPQLMLKPDYLDMPAHLAVDLRACLAGDDADPVLRISGSADWLGIFDPQQQPQPRMRQLLQDLQSWLQQPQDFTAGQLPTLAFMDAAPLLKHDLRQHSFDWGQGISVITQFSQDGFPLLPDRFHYVFQALSHDGADYVLLLVPMQLPTLPAAVGQQQFEVDLAQVIPGSEQERLLQAQLLERASAFLDTHRDQFTPPREELEQIVRSLRRVPAR